MRSMRELLTRVGGENKGAPDVGVDDKTIFFLFGKVVEEQYGVRGKKVVKPVRFEGDTLIVQVASPLWANELLIQKQVLCGRVNTLLGKEVLTEIFVRHQP